MFLTGRLRRGRRGDVGNPPKARHPSAAKATPLELDPLGRLLEPDRHSDARRPARSSDVAARGSVRRCAARRSSRSTTTTSRLTRRVGSRSRSAARRPDQEQAGAIVAVRTRTRKTDALCETRCAGRRRGSPQPRSTAARCSVRLRRGDTLTDRRPSDQSIALIVKRRAVDAGVDPAKLSGQLAAHRDTRPQPPAARGLASRSARPPTSRGTRAWLTYAALRQIAQNLKTPRLQGCRVVGGRKQHYRALYSGGLFAICRPRTARVAVKSSWRGFATRRDARTDAVLEDPCAHRAGTRTRGE